MQSLSGEREGYSFHFECFCRIEEKESFLSTYFFLMSSEIRDIGLTETSIRSGWRWSLILAIEIGDSHFPVTVFLKPLIKIGPIKDDLPDLKEDVFVARLLCYSLHQLNLTIKGAPFWYISEALNFCRTNTRQGITIPSISMCFNRPRTSISLPPSPFSSERMGPGNRPS